MYALLKLRRKELLCSTTTAICRSSDESSARGVAPLEATREREPETSGCVEGVSSSTTVRGNCISVVLCNPEYTYSKCTSGV